MVEVADVVHCFAEQYVAKFGELLQEVMTTLPVVDLLDEALVQEILLSFDVVVGDTFAWDYGHLEDVQHLDHDFDESQQDVPRVEPKP